MRERAASEKKLTEVAMHTKRRRGLNIAHSLALLSFNLHKTTVAAGAEGYLLAYLPREP